MTPAEAHAAAQRLLGPDAAAQARVFLAACGGDPDVMRAIAAGLREIASEVVALVPQAEEPRRVDTSLDLCGARSAAWRTMGREQRRTAIAVYALPLPHPSIAIPCPACLSPVGSVCTGEWCCGEYETGSGEHGDECMRAAP